MLDRRVLQCVVWACGVVGCAEVPGGNLPLDQGSSATGERKIVGGRAVEDDNTGVQAALFYVFEPDAEPFFFCGGTVVDARRGWVVTAAHCTIEYDEAAPNGWLPMDPAALRVAVGESRLSTIAQRGAYLEVSRVVRHPDYDDWTFENDIALLQVEGLPRSTPTARLAGTRLRDLWIWPGRTAVATGWGYTRPHDPGFAPYDDEPTSPGLAPAVAPGALRSLPREVSDEGDYPDTLREVSLPLASQWLCEQAVQDPYLPGVLVTESMLCAGSLRGGRDTCFGDSGGPLVVEEEPLRPVLVGVTSWAFGCAWPGQLGVYTRVTSFTPWLLECMDDPGACEF